MKTVLRTTLRTIKRITPLIAVALLVIGCGKSKKGPVDDGFNDAGVPGAPNSLFTGEFSTGSTAKLTVESDSRMSQFVQRTLNNPENVKVNLSLDDFGGGAYGGIVRIAYDDGGEHVVDEFTAGNNSHDARHNVWFTNDGQEVWHGFFEDDFGGLVVVVDGGADLGDGGAVTGETGGSVWFKNFASSSAPNPSNGCLPGFGCPDTRCWDIEIGPYSCQSFLLGDKIYTTAMVEPNNGYVLLGRFTELDSSKAFNK